MSSVCLQAPSDAAAITTHLHVAVLTARVFERGGQFAAEGARDGRVDRLLELPWRRGDREIVLEHAGVDLELELEIGLRGRAAREEGCRHWGARQQRGNGEAITHKTSASGKVMSVAERSTGVISDVSSTSVPTLAKQNTAKRL